jgi:hypothetical protein
MTSLDAKIRQLRDAAVRRLAAIMDVPADTMTDLAGMSHWASNWAALNEETDGCATMPVLSDHPRVYRHVQETRADTWIIPHGLGCVPTVTVIIPDGACMVLTEDRDPDVKTTVIRFGEPVAGRAY